MKKFFLFFASFLIGIGLFLTTIKWVGWDEIQKSFLVFSHWQGLLIFFLTFLTFLISAWKWQIILKAMGQKVSFKNFFQTYLAGFSIRYFVPVAIFFSEIFQAKSLKEINKISWPKSLASVIIERISDLTINLIIILFSFLFFIFKIGFYQKNFWFLSISFLFLVNALIFYFYFKVSKKESIIKAIVNFFNKKKNNDPLETEKEIFNFFSFKKIIIWKIFLLSWLKALIFWLRTWLLILFLGKKIGILFSLVILGFYYFVLMIPIPASLGSHEIFQIFAFNNLNLEAGTAVAFVLIIRTVEIILAFFGLFVLGYLSIKLLKNILEEKIKKLKKIF